MDTEEPMSVKDNHETLISNTDVELLKRAWRNEKSAPEILQLEASLVQRSKEQIELASARKSQMERDLLRFACYKFIKKPLVNGFHLSNPAALG